MNRAGFIASAIFAGFGAAIAIAVLAFSESLLSDVILVMAPLGASAVLVFSVSDSPLAQPKNVIFGHVLTATIGVAFLQIGDASPLMLGLATGAGVTAMLLTKTTHPPAGANPLLIMMTQQGWWFIITPVLIGAISVVVVGILAKKLQLWLISDPKIDRLLKN